MDKVKAVLGRGESSGMPKPPFSLMLSQMLFTERQLCDVLPKLIEESSDPELKVSLETHLQETRQHVTKVEKIFEDFHAMPEETRAPVMEALKTVHSELSSATSKDLGDVVVASAAAATEHFEISMYEALRSMAEAVGRSDVAGEIDRILAQERHALELASKGIAKSSRTHSRDLAA